MSLFLRSEKLVSEIYNNFYNVKWNPDPYLATESENSQNYIKRLSTKNLALPPTDSMGNIT